MLFLVACDDSAGGPAAADMAVIDAARPDAARPDAARPDAALPDAALPDAAVEDALVPLPDDADGDRVRDADDNCPAAANPDQQDTDSDGAGDLCDPNPVRANVRLVRGRLVDVAGTGQAERGNLQGAGQAGGQAAEAGERRLRGQLGP